MANFFYYLCRELFLIPLSPFSRLSTSGMELVPKTGPGLVVSNHISHADPPYMTARFPRPIHFMADRPLLEIPILGRMMRWGHVFPIDRTKNDRAALRTAMARLEAGNLVGIFPEKGIRHGATSVLGGAELPIGTASFWKMMNVPVIPMVIIGSDQMYALKNFPRRPRVFVRVGKPLPCDKDATKEELRDRIVTAWRELFEAMKQEYDIRPDELPQSAQERWGQPAPAPASPEN
jgi:1-acyl-sn-glycerol-3-phosphate acyltransferase